MVCSGSAWSNRTPSSSSTRGCYSECPRLRCNGHHCEQRRQAIRRLCEAYTHDQTCACFLSRCTRLRHTRSKRHICDQNSVLVLYSGIEYRNCILSTLRTTCRRRMYPRGPHTVHLCACCDQLAHHTMCERCIGDRRSLCVASK